MRKMFALAALVLTLMVVAPTPAPVQAAHYETICRTHNGPDGAGGAQFRVCIQVNDNDFIIRPVLSGHSDWDPGLPGPEHVSIQFDRPGTGGLELRQRDPDGTYDVVRARNTNWLSNTSTRQVATAEYEHCNQNQARYYKTTARYHIRWEGFPNNPVSDWYTLATDPVWFGQGSCPLI